MIHPDTELRFIHDKIGYGVVAKKLIPKGTVTWVLDKLDRIFSPDQIRQLDPLYQQMLDTYTYRNSEGSYVLCWDNARFINHSSNSNCLTTAYEFEIAIRDIQAGEELTDDYGYLNIETPLEVLPEEGTNRTVILPDDLLRYYPLWDDKLLEAFPEIVKVPQPLISFLSNDLQGKVRRIACGIEKMDSILHCYHPPSKGKINGEARSLTFQSPKIVYPLSLLRQHKGSLPLGLDTLDFEL